MGVEDWQNPSCWLLHLLVILRGAIVICETMLFEKAHDSGLHVSLSCFNPQVIDVTANFVDPIVFVGWILYFDEFVGKLAHVFIGSIQSCWGSMGFQTIPIPHLSPQTLPKSEGSHLTKPMWPLESGPKVWWKSTGHGQKPLRLAMEFPSTVIKRN